MKNCLYIIVFTLLASCNSVKRSENKLYNGDYDEAIRLSIKKIKKSSNKKSTQQHIRILQDAFKKVVAEDLARVQLLEQENNPEDSREIFSIYETLDFRQNLIIPLLPLPNVTFDIINYNDEIIASKNNYSEYLFTQATDYLENSNDIFDARKAYDYFSTVKQLLPNKYQNLDSLLEEAHYQGTDFVLVKIQNRTQQVIPRRLEQAILDFDTYDLDDFWTEYHNTTDSTIDYNFGIVLDIREILISPERILEKEFDRIVQVLDGWDYVLDSNGNVKKDSLGNDIKVDVLKELKAKVLVSNQSKSVAIGGVVQYRNLKQNKNISKFPIVSEFIFEHQFANFRGDKEALTIEDKNLIRIGYLDFPTNEQMIFDTSTDLKNKFARILQRRSFR
tara:strand:+ start:2447 stop:3616 length:1170 start_codon:yes stop_codon:yes gene_type:complete